MKVIKNIASLSLIIAMFPIIIFADTLRTTIEDIFEYIENAIKYFKDNN